MTLKRSKPKPRFKTSERRRESNVGQRQPMTDAERAESEAAFDLILQGQMIDGTEFLTLRGVL